jgi:hypothetical protein
MMMMLARFSAVDRARIFGRALSQSRNPFSTSAARPGALTFRELQLARIMESLGTPLYDDETRLSLVRWLESLPGWPVSTDLARATVEHVLPKLAKDRNGWSTSRGGALLGSPIGNLALMDYART